MKFLTLIIIACFLYTPVHAKKLYKYKDSQGLWHFSDTPPKTKQVVEVRQLKSAIKRYIWLEKKGSKQSPEYFVINNHKAPVEIEFNLNKSNNAISTPALPKRFIIPSGQSKTLFQITGINQYKSWSYSLKYRYVLGSSSAYHDTNAVYIPPFEKNSTIRISQAFEGPFSHTDEQNKYAVDLMMPINTPVHAARAGVVIEVNNDFFQGGTKQAYKSRANSIRILHEDGSMAVYAHLALETAQVYPGLKVYAGQLIGYSGNTGFSSGPHLHFAVQLNKGMQLVSIPFKFTESDGTVNTPVAGTFLIN
ncbi:MAG: peptidoglycan DD-metalloendopeptidase family protein [Methylococcaceae bacterium]|nr:peptidoglycan DD-metalloendopeptidase family protein [Methylococcaceae bacterium]